MKYYSITVKSGSRDLHPGERYFNAHAPLSIGQTIASDIRIPCDEDMLPQCFCSFVCNPSGNGWQLIRKSDYYPVRINGEEMQLVSNLKDGDTITVEGYGFLFNERDDENYVEGLGLVRMSPKRHHLLLFGISLLAVLALSLAFPIFIKRLNSFTGADNIGLKSSIYKISVDSFLFQEHGPGDAAGVYRTVDIYETDSSYVGTCFFTKDSLCVTARHCVEPWLDFDGWSDNVPLSSLPKHVCWAVLAEKSCLEQKDTLYRIVSHCKVTDGDTCILDFTSDACSFNRTRDIIARMGDDRLPWRIIYPLFSRKNVELGDFAFMKTRMGGRLELADDHYLTKMDDDGASEIRIYGYPKTNHGNLWTYQTVSNVIVPSRDKDGFSQCLRLNVSGTSGFSGAPVIEKKRGRMTVVGIFSKIDDFVDSKNTFYAVPASEVSQYNPVEANETKQFRR